MPRRRAHQATATPLLGLGLVAAATTVASTLGLAAAASGGGRSVVVLRHCARSTPYNVYGAKAYSNVDNYTSTPFPAWPVAAYQCLPRGIDIIEHLGTQFLELGLECPVSLTYDASAQRDHDTAYAVAKGLGNCQHNETGSAWIFDPPRAGKCPDLTSQERVAAKLRRYHSFAAPADHEKRLERIQTVCGAGVAPPIQSIPDYVSNTSGFLDGGSSIASAITEMFLMQLGGGIEAAWGRASPEDIYGLLEAHIYYRGVNARVPEIVARTHSYMASAIMSYLRESDADGTWVLVGHDTDLDALAALIGLEWDTAPFPPNATTPGSALRFRRTEDGAGQASVETSLIYNEFDSTAPKVMSVAANFTGISPGASGARNALTMDAFVARVEARLDPKCSPKSEHPSGAALE